MNTPPKNNSAFLVGQPFPSLCPSFEQEEENEKGGAKRRVEARFSITLRMKDRTEQSPSGYPYSVDIGLIEFVMNQARACRVSPQIEVNANSLNPLLLSIDGCTLNHQAEHGEKEWGAHITFLRAIAGKYKLEAFFEDLCTDDGMSLLYRLNENLVVTEVAECGDGG